MFTKRGNKFVFSKKGHFDFFTTMIILFLFLFLFSTQFWEEERSMVLNIALSAGFAGLLISPPFVIFWNDIIKK